MLNWSLFGRTQRPADYLTVAASQTAQSLKFTLGASGNVLYGLLVSPTAVGAAAITLIDGSGSDKVTIVLSTAGTLVDLKPFWIDLGGIVSQKAGGWYLTTGGNITVLAIGLFT